MNINDLRAGRELDVLIAEKVMGWTNIRYDMGTTPEGRVYVEVDNYSTEISAAWSVVEKLEHDGFEVEVIYAPSNGWSVTFEKGGQFGGSYRNDHQMVAVPLAICIAALKAVGA